MKKTTLILTICTLWALQSSCQFRIGLTSSYMSTDAPIESLMLVGERSVVSHKLTYLEQRPSYALGFTMYSEFGYIWLRGSLMYTNIEKVYDLDDYEEFTSGRMVDKHQQVQVPVLSGVKLFNFARVGVGPVFRISVDEHLSLLNYKGFKKSNRLLNNSGFQFVLGVELLKKIHLDLVIEQGLLHTGENYTFYDIPMEYVGRNRSVGINLSLML